SWPSGRIGRRSIYCTFTDWGPDSRADLGEPHLEKAVLVARADRLGSDRHRQPEAALERTDLDLHRVVVRLPLAPRLALAADGENAVGELDREILRAHAGDVQVDHERVLDLVDVRRRLPFGGRDEAHRPPVRDLVEVDLELVGEMHGERPRAARRPRSHGAL